MKLSLAVGGILSSQTLLPVVSWEAKVLSNTKLDTDDPRSCEEPPVFRGGSHLMHVGSMCYNTLQEDDKHLPVPSAAVGEQEGN